MDQKHLPNRPVNQSNAENLNISAFANELQRAVWNLILDFGFGER